MPFTEDVKGALKAPCCIIFMVVLQICLRTGMFATLHSLPAKDIQLRYFENNYCQWIFVLKLSLQK